MLQFAKDEEVLWQGRPKPKARLEWESLTDPLHVLYFVALSAVLVVTTHQKEDFAWIIGMWMLLVGLYHLVGIHFWKAYLRKHRHYTLTNKQAFIVSTYFGRSWIRSYPITRTTDITLEQRGLIGDVYFATREHWTEDENRITRIGFEQIENPRHVWSLMTQIQERKLRRFEGLP